MNSLYVYCEYNYGKIVKIIELGCQVIHRNTYHNTSTLNRALLKYRCKSKMPRKVPLLTDQHKKRKLEWRYHYKDHDMSSFFKRVELLDFLELPESKLKD